MVVRRFVVALGLLWTASAAAQTAAEMERNVNIMVRLCLAGGQRFAISGGGTGGADVRLRSLDVKGNLKGELQVEKSQVEGLVEGINNAMSQVAADQADKVRACLQPVRERLLDILLPPSTKRPPTPGPAEPTRNPLTPAETAIDGYTLAPGRTLDSSFRQSTINGVSYTNALVMSVHRPSRIEINASRSHSRFLGDLGVPDNQKSESAYQVDVSFDNAAPVFSTEVRFGETRPLDLDVTNVLRIRISISPIGRSRGYLTIGNPRFR